MAALSFVALGITSVGAGARGEAAVAGSDGGLAHPAISAANTSKNNVLDIGNISFRTSTKIRTIFPLSYKGVVLEAV